MTERMSLDFTGYKALSEGLRAEVERLKEESANHLNQFRLSQKSHDECAVLQERTTNLENILAATTNENRALRAEVERVTDVAYAHCSRADAREADIERITAHYAGAMELANRKVSLMTALLRRAVPLVAFCAPKDSTLVEEIRREIHE